jgi:16S rRNA (guanine966-N2)-methyltransferase
LRKKSGNKKAASNSFRIIGGEWRGRRLSFADNPAIRPTPDRVRETLFNWLQSTTPSSRCLDLFAGSGALGLEALSRGASQVEFVELDRKSTAVIKENIELLESDNGEVITRDALQFLSKLTDGESSSYDLIFLDPPFATNLLERSLAQLEKMQLSSGALIYIELDSKRAKEAHSALELNWKIVKSGEAGKVKYMLVRRSESYE